MNPDGVHADDWDGHVLLLHRSESQRQAGLSRWVRRGLQLGSKIFYIERSPRPPERSVLALLQHRVDAGEAVDRGQIEVLPADDTACDPAWQAAKVEEALEQGYPSVRWSGQARSAWSVMSRDRHAAVERAVDELCRTHPVAVLCQYAVSDTDEELPHLCEVHGAGVRDQRLTAVPFEGGVGVAGEADRSNQGVLRAALSAAAATVREDPLHVCLRRLQFVDVSGSRALLQGTASFREAGGRVRLLGPAPHVERFMRLLRVDRAPGVSLVREV